MGLNSCCSLVKYLIVLVNLLFWILGLSIIVISVWMITDPSFIISMTQEHNHYYISLYIFLAVGALMLIVAFLGCCGACKESQCLLVSFFCCLLIVIVAEIAAGAWAFHNKDKLDEMVRVSVKRTVQEEYGEFPTRTQAFDTFQRQLECCGAEGPHDWAASKFNKVDRTNVLNLVVSNLNPFYNIPASCCVKDLNEVACEETRTNIGIGALIHPNLHSRGCMDKLIEAIHNHWTILLGVMIAIIFMELFALFFALALCCAIKNDDHYKA